MVLDRTSVHIVLWTIMYPFLADVNASPCATVYSPFEVVPFGSLVTASCHIKEDCPLTKGQEFLVQWNHNSALVHSIKGNQDKNTYEILISNFTDSHALLECLVCSHDNCHTVDGVTIKAAYPPSAPQNLTCQLNLTDPYNLMCKWDSGQEREDITTNYTLQTEISDSSLRFNYTLTSKEHFFRVPRSSFNLFNQLKVSVVAENAVGRATSELVLNPMETVKLDAPKILGVGSKRFGCLLHSWSLSETQKWIRKNLFIEIKLKPMNNTDKEKVIPTEAKPDWTEVCGLLDGMKYESQMRVRYHTSAPWSEWSKPEVATTPMKAPTGQLVTWLKLSKQPGSRHETAHLYWKPSSQFHANSMNVSYTVSRKGKSVCVTVQQHCSFLIPERGGKVSLTAMNAAGKSSPTDVAVYRRRELEPVTFLRAVPNSEDILLTEWTGLVQSTVSGYGLEWKALTGETLNLLFFEIVDKLQTSFVITGLEPYTPYEISVYPMYKDGIGLSCSTVTYTKEKAPSVLPMLKFGEIGPSYIKLFWNEIPLEQRNGIITGYKVFYWNEKNNTEVLHTEVTNTHVVLKELHPSSIYKIMLMTSTLGGSLNSSIVTVKTTSVDTFELFLIIIPACIGATLLFIAAFTCFSNNKWIKKYVWPMIPDPANSNIKKWTVAESLTGILPTREFKEPALVYISHFSLLSLSEKELWKGNENLKSCKWAYEGESADEAHSDSSHETETSNLEQQGESVPYATVIFSGPYRTQPVPPPVYLRSESTQPLLSEEEPSTPNPYEHISKQVNLPDVENFLTFPEDFSGEEKSSLPWEDFPMLKSLEMTGINSKI